MSCTKTVKHTPEVSSVKDAYFHWVHRVESSRGVPDGVTDLYADNAILFPTLSSDMCTNRRMINDYFVFFLKLKDLQVETKSLITRVYGDIAMNAGYYDISYMNGKKKEVVRARFDFWYKKVGDEWKIIFHQSSMLPGDN